VNQFDPRITPARPDLAAAHVKGNIPAVRYVEGQTKQAIRGQVALRAAPSFDALLHTEIFFGELFTVYEEKNGWSWGQAQLDSYVGYARSSEFASSGQASSHRVNVFKTPLLPAPDAKCSAVDFLPFNAMVAVLSRKEGYAQVAAGLFVFLAHLVPLSSHDADWVAVAEHFLGAAYLWGGRQLTVSTAPALSSSRWKRAASARRATPI
jgi:hypothetical protein